MSRNSRFVFSIFALGILLIGALYFLFAPEGEKTIPEVFLSTSTDGGNIPAGFTVYENSKYGIAIAHPSLAVQEYTEAAGSMTITFDDPESSRDFQIFVLPYKETQIALSRIEKDTRGTATEPSEIIIGSGMRALLFESTDSLLGPLREVWFIHNGYLFEVTVPTGNDPWIAEILGTIKTL